MNTSVLPRGEKQGQSVILGQSSPKPTPTTHRSNRFNTLIPHLTESHSTIVFPFSQPLLEQRAEGKRLHMADLAGDCSRSQSPLSPPFPDGWEIFIFNAVVVSAPLPRGGSEDTAAPVSIPTDRFILTLPNLPFASQLPQPQGVGPAR